MRAVHVAARQRQVPTWDWVLPAPPDCSFPLHLDRCAAYVRGRYRGWTAAKLASGVLKPRTDLLLWGPDVDGGGGVGPESVRRQHGVIGAAGKDTGTTSSGIGKL
jgi:hypothetical protein